jgi:hypothetical protein
LSRIRNIASAGLAIAALAFGEGRAAAANYVVVNPFTGADWSAQITRLLSLRTTTDHRHPGGWSTMTVSLASIRANPSCPGTTDADKIRSCIGTWYAPTTDLYVVLLGDWNDGSTTTANPSGQPQYRNLPTFYIANPDVGGIFSSQVASDLLYADVDHDGLLNERIHVGRIPAHSAAELGVYIDKLQARTSFGAIDNSALLLAENVTRELRPGNIVEQDVNRLATALTPRYATRIQWDEAPNDMVARQAAAVSALDMHPQVVIGMGTLANRVKIVNMLQAQAGFQETMLSTLAPNDPRYSLLFGLSCEMGDFDMTESGNGRPILERLLFAQSRGLFGAIAPTRTAVQEVYRALGNELAARMVANTSDDVRVGKLVVDAIRAATARLPVHREALLSFAVLGDPAAEVFLPKAPTGTGGPPPKTKIEAP